MSLSLPPVSKIVLPRVIKKACFPTPASSGCHPELLIYTSMSAPLSRIVAVACAVLVLGAATTASARPKKHRAEPAATATTTNCYGTPIIMQGMGCPTRPGRGEAQEQEQATERAERPRVRARGSSGTYNPALLRPPSLSLPQQSAGPYIPPPINNPSAQINQLNHSFPLNGGLGNNPTDRDAYIRYNLTR
jgi:hypothetical protein